MDKNKRLLTYVIALIILAIGVTFAYFVAQTGDGAKSSINIKADSVDDLKFSVDKDLSLSANQFNFAQGQGNLSDSVTAKASLKANSTKSTATYNYYVYFQMESNEYKYTTDNKLPEIVLSITGPNGEVKSVDGLTYVTASDADGKTINGFDITELGSSIIKIADSFEISSSSSTNYTNQEWVFKVTFINLNTDQTGNQGKTMTGKVLMQEDKILTLTDYVVSQYTGIQGENNIYYHDSNLENGAGDNSYRFAGANPNNYVCFGSSKETCPTDNLYRIIGAFDGLVKLIKYDYVEAFVLGYDGDCTRIVSIPGSIYKGQSERIYRFYWNYKSDTSINDGKGSNEWNTSLLNTINLNKNYLNYIGTKWSNMIEDATWKVSGHNTTSVTASAMFTAEITNATKTYGVKDGASKIGLMYASDYGFAAEPSAWKVTLDNYENESITSTNWMHMGFSEWTLSPTSSVVSDVFYVSYDGSLTATTANDSFVAIRPVLYLKASIMKIGGDGSTNFPFRISN